MKILFVGYLYPHERHDEIKNNSKGFFDNASNNFQWAIIEGLDYYFPDLKILTLPNIQSFPLYYTEVIFKKSIFSHKIGAEDRCLGFINLPIIKHINKNLNLYKEINKLIEQDEETTIIIYGVTSHFLRAAIDIKEKNCKIKICLIAPDLPEYMSESKNPIYLIFKKFDSMLIERYLKKVDSFVILSDHMVDKLKVRNRPWIRIEGIFKSPKEIESIKKEINKTILYTGTLDRRYGIMNLIRAFISINADNYRLWICGEGDLRNEIKKIASLDKRIIYFGQLNHDEILIMQKKATVLINPRTSEGIYTKYSFPSKIMEYFASGTPTIMYKLKGIPDEYYKYCYIIKNESIEDLKEMIITVCEKDQEELNDFGKRSSQFIIENKNPIIQTKKIFKMLNILKMF